MAKRFWVACGIIHINELQREDKLTALIEPVQRRVEDKEDDLPSRQLMDWMSLNIIFPFLIIFSFV